MLMGYLIVKTAEGNDILVKWKESKNFFLSWEN